MVNYMIVEVGEVKEGLEPGDNECRQFREVRISERREKQYGMAEEESESRRRIDSWESETCLISDKKGQQWKADFKLEERECWVDKALNWVDLSKFQEL